MLLWINTWKQQESGLPEAAGKRAVAMLLKEPICSSAAPVILLPFRQNHHPAPPLLAPIPLHKIVPAKELGFACSQTM